MILFKIKWVVMGLLMSTFLISYGKSYGVLLKQSAVLTITGTVRDLNGNVTKTYVDLCTLGKPFFDDINNREWKPLVQTGADVNGNYSFVIDRAKLGNADTLVVSALYGYPWYSVIRRVSINNESVIQGIDFVLPALDESKLSIKFRIFENNQEIDYKRKIYSVTLIQQGVPDNGISAMITTGNFLVTENQFFDLPAGTYRLACNLSNLELSDDSVAVKQFDITLPLQDNTIPLDISFP